MTGEISLLVTLTVEREVCQFCRTSWANDLVHHRSLPSDRMFFAILICYCSPKRCITSFERYLLSASDCTKLQLRSRAHSQLSN